MSKNKLKRFLILTTNYIQLAAIKIFIYFLTYELMIFSNQGRL